VKLAGGILVVLGFVLLLVGGLSYKEKKDVAVLGDLKMQVTEEKKLQVPPVISGLLILVGAAMVFAPRKPAV
jgi:hypothetical protein